MTDWRDDARAMTDKKLRRASAKAGRQEVHVTVDDFDSYMNVIRIIVAQWEFQGLSAHEAVMGIERFITAATKLQGTDHNE